MSFLTLRKVVFIAAVAAVISNCEGSKKSAQITESKAQMKIDVKDSLSRVVLNRYHSTPHCQTTLHQLDFQSKTYLEETCFSDSEKAVETRNVKSYVIDESLLQDLKSGVKKIADEINQDQIDKLCVGTRVEMSVDQSQLFETNSCGGAVMKLFATLEQVSKSQP